MKHVPVCDACSSPVYFKDGAFYHDVLPRMLATIVRKVKCLAKDCEITVEGNRICHSSVPASGQSPSP